MENVLTNKKISGYYGSQPIQVNQTFGPMHLK